MKKIVIKFGTSSLTKGGHSLSLPQMLEFVRQIADLQEQGFQIVLVSSAAIAAGRESLPAIEQGTCLPTKQMLASIGQVRLMQAWTELFHIYGILVGQVLLTRGDMEDTQRRENARNTIERLMASRVIPIINENDTISTEEISLGDNDNLSALVAILIRADLLFLLTDQEGLFTADPRTNPQATLITQIENFNESHFFHAAASSNPLGLGKGGMTTKIEAARKAHENGITSFIASSRAPNAIVNLANGKPHGTRICPHKKFSTN